MDTGSSDLAETKQLKRPRFQLCFATNDRITTKSDIYKATVKLFGISTPIITPKFYTKNKVDLTGEDEKEVASLIKKLEALNDIGPREKYKEPVLESHRYGWFQEKFIEPIPNVDRVHYPKRTSEMVKMQNMFMQTKASIGERCD